MIVERIPAMPLGNKKTLARKAAGTVLLKMLQDRDPEVVELCLNNPNMVEAHLFKIINREDTTPDTIMMVARHPNWSTRGLIRFSLARNAAHAPVAVRPFSYQHEIHGPAGTLCGPFAAGDRQALRTPRALCGAGKNPEQGLGEEVIEIAEEEMAEFDAERKKAEISDENEEDIARGKTNNVRWAAAKRRKKRK